ncbi:MAG TPA: RNA methyltransferase [Polyangiaceae bacterium]|nr:RNA methyltransferase [Polyangiaceae bacterium]
MRRIAAALVHYPVLDREHQIVTGAITNIDLHDLSRSAHSYGLSDLFAIHPVAAQRELAERIREHWVTGAGGKRIPDRKPALEMLRVVETLEQAQANLGPDAELWTTSASALGDRIATFSGARSLLAQDGPPVLLCFGTGWGLADEIHERAAVRLEPIRSPRADGYNHLSVRAAAAIIFDRLLSPI